MSLLFYAVMAGLIGGAMIIGYVRGKEDGWSEGFLHGRFNNPDAKWPDIR